MDKYKYHRTFHLSWSEGKSNDDKTVPNEDHFIGEQVVVTIKMDGECSTLMSNGYTHARSLDSTRHESRDWLKAWWNQRAFNLPSKWRICGENVYAMHSIHYTDLESYFYGFSLWEKDKCLHWDDTMWEFARIGVIPVNIIYQGIYDEQKIKQSFEPYKEFHEGYVVRKRESYLASDSHLSIAKYVRKNHVQTDEHWLSKPVVKNLLRK